MLGLALRFNLIPVKGHGASERIRDRLRRLVLLKEECFACSASCLAAGPRCDGSGRRNVIAGKPADGAAHHLGVDRVNRSLSFRLPVYPQ